MSGNVVHINEPKIIRELRRRMVNVTSREDELIAALFAYMDANPELNAYVTKIVTAFLADTGKREFDVKRFALELVTVLRRIDDGLAIATRALTIAVTTPEPPGAA